MAERAVEGLMGLTVDKIREMADSETVIGKPIQAPNGTVILPVSKVTIGLGSGGSDFGEKGSSFGGGGGAGISISPVAFLVISAEGNVRTVQLSDSGDVLDKVITMIPELVDKISEKIGKKNKEEATKE